MSAGRLLKKIFTVKKVQDEKKAIRKHIGQYLKTQKEEDRLRKSLVILEKVFATPEFQASKTILFYASFDGEVETFEMMRRAQQLRKKIALPFILKEEKKIIPTLVDNLTEDLRPGPYGIRQPRLDKQNSIREDELDLLIIPGIAFDKSNRRLGRGAGYYDRFLANLSKDIPSFGLGFDFQIVDHLPHQEHDVPLSRVINN